MYQALISKPGTPASIIVGSSGASGERFGPVVASAFSLPLRTSGSEVVMVSNMIGTWPPTTSTRAVRVALVGHRACMVVPVIDLNISAPRWAPATAPPVAKKYLFGLAFSKAMSSATLFRRKARCGVTRISGMVADLGHGHQVALQVVGQVVDEELVGGQHRVAHQQRKLPLPAGDFLAT